MAMRAVRSKDPQAEKRVTPKPPKLLDTPRNYTEIVSHRTNGSSAGTGGEQPPQRRERPRRRALLPPRLHSRNRHLGELLVAQKAAPRREFRREALHEPP